MSVKETARRQYIRLADTAAQQLSGLSDPKEGWIATIRKALSMSGAQLARRAGVTKAAIYQAERNEREGAITLNQMEKTAQALGCRFVYAIVPDDEIKTIVRQHARQKVEALVKRASAHMALEKQSLPTHETRAEIERQAEEMARNMPSDFWEDR